MRRLFLLSVFCLPSIGWADRLEDTLVHLTHTDSAVRLTAIRDLGALDHPQALTALLAALGDADSANRREIIDAILLRQGPAAVSLFAGALGSQDPAIRLGALQGLFQCGPLLLPLAPVIQRAAVDDDPRVRAEVYDHLLHCSPDIFRTLHGYEIARQALADQDPRVRILGLHLLDDNGERDAAQNSFWSIFQRMALSDPDPGVRIQALVTMSKVLGDGSVMTVLTAFTGDKSTEVRLAALTLLAPIAKGAPQNVGEAMKAALKDRDPLVRRGAARAMRDLSGYGAYAMALQAAVSDPDRQVRLEVVTVLCETHNIHSLTLLTIALRDKDPAICLMGLSLLADLGFTANRYGAKVALGLLFHRHPAIREEAARTLKHLGSPVALPFLHLALTDAVVGVRVAIRESIDWITLGVTLISPAPEDPHPDLQALTHVASRLEQAQMWEREPAAAILRKSGPVGITLLLKAAGSPQPDVREIALEQLAIAKAKDALPLLLHATEDPVVGVRVAAVWGLAAYGTPHAIKALTRAQQDRSPWVRGVAAAAVQLCQQRQAALPSRPPAKSPRPRPRP